MSTTLFLGTFRSFARERCRGPGLRSGAARARQSPEYTLLTEEYHSPRAPLRARRARTPSSAWSERRGDAGRFVMRSLISIGDASVTGLYTVRILYTSRGARSERRVR